MSGRAERSKGVAGGAEDFDLLYARYHRLVRSVLYKIARSDQLDDLVQETFFKIWRGRETVADARKLTAWVCRVAVNAARDAWRAEKHVPPPSPLNATMEAQPDGSPEAKELLLRGLESLSVAHREVLVLHCLEGIPVEEVAEALEISAGTVKSRLHYARSTLYEFLKRNGGMP